MIVNNVIEGALIDVFNFIPLKHNYVQKDLDMKV
jgi:hypothetical protein